MATYQIQENTPYVYDSDGVTILSGTPIVVNNNCVSFYVKFIKTNGEESSVQYYEVSVGDSSDAVVNSNLIKQKLQEAADLYDQAQVFVEGSEAALISELLS